MNLWITSTGAPDRAPALTLCQQSTGALPVHRTLSTLSLLRAWDTSTGHTGAPGAPALISLFSKRDEPLHPTEIRNGLQGIAKARAAMRGDADQ